MKFVRRLCHDRESAEELTQETFLRAFRSYGRFQNEKPIVNWLMRIAKNAFLDQRRFDSRRPRLLLESYLSDTNGLNAFVDPNGFDGDLHEPNAAVIRILEAAKGLSLPHQRLFHLAYVEERPYDEIASITGVSVACVRSRLFRIRNQLRAAVLPKQSEAGTYAIVETTRAISTQFESPFRPPRKAKRCGAPFTGGRASSTRLRPEESQVRQ